MFKDETLPIAHSPARRAALAHVEDELIALRSEGVLGEAGTLLTRACSLTLVIFCDVNDTPASLSDLISRIVMMNPARVILITQNTPEGDTMLESWVSLYYSAEGRAIRITGEQITLQTSGAKYYELPSAVLGLRVTGVPFVLYWRGQPDLNEPLFSKLIGDSDQMLFDSAHFTARSEQVNRTIARLRSEYRHISFGDVNWQRIRTWRELLAQYFDDPANLRFLQRITAVELDFSTGENGNQSQAMLFMAWLSSALEWQVIKGSYQREGLSRAAKFLQNGRLIPVTLRVRELNDAMPGALSRVVVQAEDDMPAQFEIVRAPGGYVDLRQQRGPQLVERCAALELAEESAVVASELNAPRRDRNYHRALQIIEDLVMS